MTIIGPKELTIGTTIVFCVHIAIIVARVENIPVPIVIIIWRVQHGDKS